jgi:hypothetical protein
VIVFGFLIGAAIFLLILIIGGNLFAAIVGQQVLYLRLMIDYAPLSPTNRIPSHPEFVSRCLSWTLSGHTDPVGCVHIRHTGKIRYGKTGRWMEIRGESIFSLATPGFVWHAKITYFPGIWIEAFDYYAHREAGMNLNLFPVFPLTTIYDGAIKTSSLFRYLASAPLYPIALVPVITLEWQNVSDLTARLSIRDNDLSAEALVHFDGSGRIQNIEACHRNQLENGRPVPGYFMMKFSDYTDVKGYKIPLQISSDLILPEGQSACIERTISSIVFEIPGKICRSGF